MEDDSNQHVSISLSWATMMEYWLSLSTRCTCTGVLFQFGNVESWMTTQLQWLVKLLPSFYFEKDLISLWLHSNGVTALTVPSHDNISNKRWWSVCCSHTEKLSAMRGGGRTRTAQWDVTEKLVKSWFKGLMQKRGGRGDECGSFKSERTQCVFYICVLFLQIIPLQQFEY